MGKCNSTQLFKANCSQEVDQFSFSRTSPRSLKRLPLNPSKADNVFPMLPFLLVEIKNSPKLKMSQA
jgi:hypothetical protein